MWRLFRTYGRPHGRHLRVGLLASLVARLADLAPPLLLGLAIDTLFFDRPVPFPVVAERLPTSAVGLFGVVVGLLAAAFLVSSVFHLIRGRALNRFAQRVQHELRVDTYDRMQRLDVAFFDDKQTGELMSVLSNDVNNLEQFLMGGIDAASRLSVTVGGILVLLFLMNAPLAAVAFLPVPLIAYFTYRYVGIYQPRYAEVRGRLAGLLARLENNLGGIRVIKSATAESFERDRVGDASADYHDTYWGAIRVSTTFFPILRVINGVGFVLTFAVGGYWVFFGPFGPFQGTLTVGTFVAFVFLAQNLVWPMSEFGEVINIYQRAKASAARVFDLADEQPAVREDEGAPPLRLVDGTVRYEGVTFGYDPDRPVLRDVSFAVPGGTTLGLVGPTGAGKSTVVELLARMYDPDEGRITVDGRDVREVSVSSLRGAIGYVSQDAFLFHGTVRENIAYARPDATDAEVEAAARRAHADGFVANLPDGYDTTVGERGVRLSGGQRQRVSIARAILQDPEILVFDEATSAVDTETELLIQRSLADLTADRTTVIIAHRLSTVRGAENVVVLEDGRVVEEGSHDELIARDGLYANLWAVQAGAIEGLPEEFVRRATERAAVVEARTDGGGQGD